MRPLDLHSTVVIRAARPADAAGLRRLAALDGRPELTGELLVAERDAVLVAALAPQDGGVVADPFRPTADLVALLRLQAAHDAVEARARARRRGCRAGRFATLARGRARARPA